MKFPISAILFPQYFMTPTKILYNPSKQILCPTNIAKLAQGCTNETLETAPNTFNWPVLLVKTPTSLILIFNITYSATQLDVLTLDFKSQLNDFSSKH